MTQRKTRRPSGARPARRLRFLAAAVLIAVGLLPGFGRVASAESGVVHRWRGAGLNVDVDTRWLDGGGYRPVRITVTPTGPVIADRTLTVEFSARRFGKDGRDDLRVVQDVEVPAASGPVQATLSVPHAAAWNQYTINLLEDGKLRKQFRQAGVGGDPVFWYWQESCPRLLVAGDSLPDTSALACLFGASAYYGPVTWPGMAGGAAANPPARPEPLPTAMARPASELPGQWVDYTSLDLVCLSVEELAWLGRNRPEAFRGVVEWTSAGGNLLVYGVGDEWERLAELESLVGLAPGGDAPIGDPARRGWTHPAPKLFGRAILGAGASADPLLSSMIGGGGTRVGGMPGAAVPVEGMEGMLVDGAEDPVTWHRAARQVDADDCFSFVFRDLNLGMVVAVADEDPFRNSGPRDVLGWSWALNSIGSRRLLWYQRYGLSPCRENQQFWNFLIPGVGLPPITAFRVLITLFVLAIGPANYMLLRRWKRLHLLVVTVPASAAAITLALFAYAVVADGLGTRVRVRSLTSIDQGRGHAACWSRLSYYAGLAPRGGLRFPGDVAVIPLEFLPEENRSRTQELIWGKNQWLSGGWLPARTPTQFVTVRSRPAALHLTVRPSQDQPGSLHVENHLGTRIEQVLVCAKDGRHYWAEGVEAGATAQTAPIEAREARDRLRRTFGERQPMDFVDPGRPGGSDFFARTYRRRWQGPGWIASGAPAPSQWTGLLEQAIAKVHAAELEPGSYAAVVERSPEVVVGLESAREQAGLHVIQGTW